MDYENKSDAVIRLFFFLRLCYDLICPNLGATMIRCPGLVLRFDCTFNSVVDAFLPTKLAFNPYFDVTNWLNS